MAGAPRMMKVGCARCGLRRQGDVPLLSAAVEAMAASRNASARIPAPSVRSKSAMSRSFPRAGPIRATSLKSSSRSAASQVLSHEPTIAGRLSPPCPHSRGSDADENEARVRAIERMTTRSSCCLIKPLWISAANLTKTAQFRLLPRGGACTEKQLFSETTEEVRIDAHWSDRGTRSAVFGKRSQILAR